MQYDLGRFKKAQEMDYQTALQEVKAGRKRSHWIWYIFPQLKGLGYSRMSEYYGLKDIAEAEAYLDDPLLKSRLLQISKALMDTGKNDPSDVFGYPVYMKVHSCMTLFSIVSQEDSIFRQVLDQFYAGRQDPGTIRILQSRGEI